MSYSQIFEFSVFFLENPAIAFCINQEDNFIVK